MQTLVRIFAISLVCLTTMVGHAFAQDEEATARKGGNLVIGTGPVNSLDYTAGGAVCAIINRGLEEHGFRCLVQPSRGTLETLPALNSGSISAVILQSDWQSYVYKGSLPRIRMTNLRHLFSLQPRAVMVLVRSGSDLNALQDLRNQRVSLGPQGSGQRILAEAVLRVANFAHSSFKETVALDPTQLYRAFCLEQSIDAAIIPTSVPSPLVQQLILGCDVKPLPLTGPQFDRLIKDNPFLSEVQIPASVYEGLSQDVNTLGFSATLVTTDSLPEEAGFVITSSVFNNLDEFRAQHPLLERLDPASMASVGAIAPRHLGAERYFDEAGIAR